MPRIPAKFHHEDQHPPSLTWQDAKTHLRHFAIISWAVDPEALSAGMTLSETREVGEKR